MMSQDGSKFTAQSLASYKKEAQEHGASILDPLQWMSKNRKTLPKLSKMATRVPSTHVITPLRNRLSPNVAEAISVNLESYKNLLL